MKACVIALSAVLLLAGCAEPQPSPSEPEPTLSGETREVCRMARQLIEDPVLMRQASFMTSLRDFGAISDPPVRDAAAQFVVGWTNPVTATAEGDQVIAYAKRIESACEEAGVTRS